mgnify:CR=1 FL=1
MSLETQKTKAGTYLYEYAAANLKKVSIRDLYMTLSGVTEEVAAFKNQESGISVDADDDNLWYCLEDKEEISIRMWIPGKMVTQQPLRRNRPIRSPLLLTGPAVPTKSVLMQQEKTARPWKQREAIY